MATNQKHLAPNATADSTLPTANKSLVVRVAQRYGVNERKLLDTLRATCFKPPKPRDNQPPIQVTDEQMVALLAVADEYKLNPFLKQVYAFPTKGGGIEPIVSIDGWIRIVQTQPEYDGEEFEHVYDERGNLESITCRMFRKDRGRPTVVNETLCECKRNTDPWNNQPQRMLRHRAYIQAARYCFGLGGISEPDEAERRIEYETAGEVVGHTRDGAPDFSAQIRSTDADQQGDTGSDDAPALTFAQVADQLNAAARMGDRDGLNEAASLIAAVPDEQQRAELGRLYTQLLGEMPE